MEQIPLSYCVPKETVNDIMIIYKNTKATVRLLDGATDFFDIVTGVFEGNILALYLFIIYLDYVLRTSIDLKKESGFTLKKNSKK